MSRVQKEANLARMCRDLEDYSLTQVPPPAAQIPGLAKKLSKSIFLANSSNPTNFASICRTGYIASQEFLSATTGVPRKQREEELGTSGDVFFDLAPFRFRDTVCGLLFAATLENDYRDDGVGTPFDSGSLHKPGRKPHVTRADPVEPVRAFLDRHELPIPEHRKYLEYSMRFLFWSPGDYIKGTDPSNPGPLGLSGGDNRRWTHEVRLPKLVFVRTQHLQAVFAPRSEAGKGPIRDLFKWCDIEGVDAVIFDNRSGADAAELSYQCHEYVKARLY